MKIFMSFALVLMATEAGAFDLKGPVEMAGKDEKMQAQAKDIGKKV